MNKLPLLLALVVSATAQAEVYRWVDENGVTIFSSSPPPDGEAQRVKIAPPPKPDPEARKRLDDALQNLEDQKEDAALTAENQGQQAQNDQISEQNCRNARSNLEKLSTLTPRRLMQTPDGNYQRLNEEQRQQQMEAARRMIDEYCN